MAFHLFVDTGCAFVKVTKWGGIEGVKNTLKPKQLAFHLFEDAGCYGSSTADATGVTLCHRLTRSARQQEVEVLTFCVPLARVLAWVTGNKWNN